MRKIFLLIAFIPVVAFSAIDDWGYMPYISYKGQAPSEVIRQGRNFEFLRTLWGKPQSLHNLQKSGFDFTDVDTALLMRQGMVYQADDMYYSAIPFVDSLAMDNLRKQASILAGHIIEDTRPEMQSFLSVLDRTGFKESAFALAHSLVFDDLIWGEIGVSMENATIWNTDSMTWSGLFYFFRPERTVEYGTNGLGLGDKHIFKFSWGSNSNAYLCTVFIKTNILKALDNILKGEKLSGEMLQDCHKYGVLDANDRLTIPVLDGDDEISKSADTWAKSAARSFARHFKVDDIAGIVGLQKDKESAAKVIFYHETLFEIDKILDERALLPIPEVLTSKMPADKMRTASVAYITGR